MNILIVAVWKNKVHKDVEELNQGYLDPSIEHYETYISWIRNPAACAGGHSTKELSRQLISNYSEQGFGSGSAWIRINLSYWIRIRIHIQIADPDPDPGGPK